MVEGGMKFVKCLLFIFNLLFFLAGLGLIIVGCIVHLQLNTYVDFFGTQFSAAAVVLIVIGGLIFVIGFFGCCGAYREQYCMIMTFAVFLGIVFLCEIGVAIAAYAMRDTIKTHVDKEMAATADQYNTTGHESLTKTWDVVQHDFDCCGVQGYQTWEHLSPNLPDSCCREEFEGCGVNGYVTYDGRFYNHGCVNKMEENVQKNMLLIGGVGLGLAFVQLIGIVLACCLGRSINSEYHIV